MISIYIFYLDKNPIIIKQDRVGLHGEIFKMYKFRTMKNNSHEEREKLKDMSKKSGPLFKISDDPRLIKGTKFMRNYSIDELPQFFNIIKGKTCKSSLYSRKTQNYLKKIYERAMFYQEFASNNERNTDEFSTCIYDIEYIDN